MIDIKDIYGNIRFSTEINAGSKRKFLLMKEDYVSLKFSLDEPVFFKLGDYMDDARWGLFELCDLYKPSYNRATNGYDYELRLDAYYRKWKNKIFKFTPEAAGREVSWNLTAPLDVQMGVFLRNLKALGYKYKGKEFEFSMDGTVENKAMLMNYDNVSLLDALSALAETWKCEWWVTDNVIHLGRCEYGTAVDFELGGNVEEMTRSDSGTEFATRIYAFGSTRNLPGDYRPGDETVVVNGVVQKRLMLPADTPYIDAYEGMTNEEAIEDVVVFDDVYPRRVGTVSDITTKEYIDTVENDDGTTTKEKWNAYRFKDAGITFSEKYVIPGEELKIIFQSGLLNGMEFAVKFNPDKKPEKLEDGSWNPAAQVWEIVRNEDYGRAIPDDVLRPQAGHMEGGLPVPADTYILSGFDASFVSAQMIPDAERELKEKAREYVAKTKIDPSTYTNKMMSDYMYGLNPVTGELDHQYAKHFDAGDRVNLINKAYFEEGRQSRIIGYEYNLDIPSDSPVYTVGESASYSRIGELESKIDSLTYKGQVYTGSGNGVYVIGTNDHTRPTNRNVFSALKSLASFLRKDREDKTDYQVKLLGGVVADHIESREFSSGPFGSGYLLKCNPKTGKSYFEVDEAYFRLKAVFEMLEIKHLSHVGGRIVLSPAGMECIKVEEVAANHEALYDSTGEQLFDSGNSELLVPVFDGETAYRCYFKQTDGEKGIVNEFAVGDLAQCREFNVKPGVSSSAGNRYYWRRVVGTGSDYIDLSKTVCDTGSTVPMAGDTIVTVGNDTDKSRQHVVFLSSYDEDAPSIKLYSGINSFSMKDKEVTVISPNADKNIFTGQMVIKPGSTGFDNLADAPDMGAIREDIKGAHDAATVAKESAEKVRESVNGLNGYIDGAFADGIISESEAKNIEKYINIVNGEKVSAESSYNILTSNPYLEGAARLSLMNARTNLSNAVTALVNSINTAIADGKTSVAEKQDVDSKYGLFNQYMGSFYEAVEIANTSIQNKLKSYSDNARKAADEANNNASSAMDTANKTSGAVSDLNGYIDGAFADGIISGAEAKAIEKYVNTVNSAKKEVEATYNVLYGNEYLEGSAKTALLNAKVSFMSSVSNLIAAIQAAIADGKTTPAEKQNVDGKYGLFSTAYAAMKAAIETANKAIQDRIRSLAGNDATQEAVSQIEKVTQGAKDDVAKQLGYTDYGAMQEAARKGQTLIIGGEVNTALINAELVVTTSLIANAIRASSLNINDKFIIFKDGNVDMNGIFHSLGIKTELVASSGYLRLRYNDNDVARFSVNENTGIPEITMYHGNQSVFISPEKMIFGLGRESFLTIDPSVLGAGAVKKTSDGMLYVTNDTIMVITVGISVSPTDGGTTSPAASPLLLRKLGENEYVNAIPAAGYQFDRWSDGGAQEHLVTWDKSGKSLTAYFTKIEVTQYTVTLNSWPENGGTVSGGGTYEVGTERTVSAVPADGYRFVKWSDGGYASHKVAWDKDKVLTAYFEEYSVTGDEIFLGTNLQGKTYTETYKAGTSGVFSVGVSNGKMSAVYVAPSGSDSAFWSDNPGWILFNKGYLGSKLSQGHRYKLAFTAKTAADKTRAYVIASVATLDADGSLNDITKGNELIYAEEVTGTDNTFMLDFTAQRDSTVSDALCLCFIPQEGNAMVYITGISLKEI